jgi:1-deoxyxylulose-5-phosphate synthase
MKYRRLGRSGFMVSEVALGTMNFGNPTTQEEAFTIINAALDGGVNLFDCADVYAEGESERILGQAFSQNRKRNEVFLTSKLFMRTGNGPNDEGNSKHHILSACENSLKRLRTDYIDLYFLHRTDWNVPQEETLAALDLLVRQGKVRHVGLFHPSAVAGGRSFLDRRQAPLPQVHLRATALQPARPPGRNRDHSHVPGI